MYVKALMYVKGLINFKALLNAIYLTLFNFGTLSFLHNNL